MVSCKGGKKEIPKAYVSRYWLFPSGREIIDRVHENFREVKEVVEEARCLKEHDAVLKRLFGVTAEKVIPVIVHAQLQPLAVSEFREKFGVSDEFIITTPSSLPRIIKVGVELP